MRGHGEPVERVAGAIVERRSDLAALLAQGDETELAVPTERFLARGGIEHGIVAIAFIVRMLAHETRRGPNREIGEDEIDRDHHRHGAGNAPGIPAVRGSRRRHGCSLLGLRKVAAWRSTSPLTASDRKSVV